MGKSEHCNCGCDLPLFATDYVILVGRKVNDDIIIYFWDGEVLTGDFSRAKIYHRYGDSSEPIWNGPLWAKNDVLKEAGFLRIISRRAEDVREYFLPSWEVAEKDFVL